MQDKIKTFEDEIKEIEDFLARPDAYASPDFAGKSRRLSELNEIVATAQKIGQLEENLKEAEELVSDPELILKILKQNWKRAR